MIVSISWNAVPIEEWEEKFKRVSRSTLLQSFPYALSMRASNFQTPRFGMILVDDKEAGLVMILEAGILWNIFHGVILDRGPLWFEGYGSAAHIKGFFDAFQKEFPPRFGLRRRIIPEQEDGLAIKALLQQVGLKRLEDRKGYETLWLDLRASEEDLRAGLKKNWLGSLKKAESEKLEIFWDEEGELIDWMISVYAADKGKRGYQGASPQLLHQMARIFVSNDRCLIGQAKKDGMPHSGVMIFGHGCGATYQAGWSSEEGRKTCANHLLLWRAALMLKQHGITDFDLGGVNDETKGIKLFKEGMGAKLSRLVGHYS